MSAGNDGPVAAISTGNANTPIGLIRLTGLADGEALPFLRQSGSEDFYQITPKDHRRVRLATFVLNGTPADTVLVTYFRAPASFTGEHLVEISLHGNQIHLKDCLREIFETTRIRPAGPGEFTKRAFLNQKLDLTQAEAIHDFISARSRFGLEKSRQNLSGFLSRQISVLRSHLLNLRADLEAELDFMDQDIEFDGMAAYRKQAEELRAKFAALLKQGRLGEAARDGVWTVISGPPNAGKSTLLNLLLGYDRAIVTDVPGTTRDFLREEFEVSGVPLQIYDTAGIRTGQGIDIVEAEGVRRSLKLRDQAGLVIHLLDARDLSDADRANPRELPEIGELANSLAAREGEKPGAGRAVLVLINKMDLVDGVASQVSPELENPQPGLYFGHTSLTAAEARSRDFLLATLGQIVEKHFHFEEGILVSERATDLLRRAATGMEEVSRLLEISQPLEIACAELNRVMELVGDVTGRIDTEEILGRVFSRFCVGK